MSLESAKKYGFISSVLNVTMPIIAILIVIGLIYQIIAYPLNSFSPFLVGFLIGFGIVSGVVGFIAVILFFLSMYRLSNYYKAPSIFRNPLYGLLLAIIFGVIMVVIELFFVVSVSSMVITTPFDTALASIIMQYIALWIAIMGMAFVISIVNGVLYWQAFNKLGEKSGVETFKTVGLLYLLGSVLQIIGVGAIITWIAWIYATKAYKQLQPQPTINNPTFTNTTTPPPSNNIYCIYCGTQNYTNVNYCKQCGKALQTNQTST